VPERPDVLLAATDGEDVLDVVAVLAQCLEAEKGLALGPIVEAPDFMAVQSGAPVADPATIARAPVGFTPQPVPKLAREQVGQAGVAVACKAWGYYRAPRHLVQVQALSRARVPEPGTEDDENGR